MQLQEKAERMLRLGLYIHVPFCAHTCGFCSFYQEAPDRAGIEGYLAAVESELQQWTPPRPANTIFFGGGTPGLLSARDLSRLCAAVRRAAGDQVEEWTVEMAPSTVKADKIAALRDQGVTRISLGVQSFQPHLLEALQRGHSVPVISRAIDTLREAGFANWSLDLIFAIPGQTLEAWEADLRTAMSWQPAHISTYCLTFEEDTALWVRLSKGQIKARTEAEEIAFYELAQDILAEERYAQYEISNFARPGFASRHNLDTWHMQEWLGYGPSASSQFGGQRFTQAHDLQAWQKGVAEGRRALIDCETLTPDTLALDSLLFGLRMNQGVDLASLENRFGIGLQALEKGLFADWAGEGWIVGAGRTFALTRSGRLLADQLAVHLMEAWERAR